MLDRGAWMKEAACIEGGCTCRFLVKARSYCSDRRRDLKSGGLVSVVICS